MKKPVFSGIIPSCVRAPAIAAMAAIAATAAMVIMVAAPHANATELRIRGTVLAPACSTAVVGEAVFGMIYRHQLQAAAYTPLARKNVALKVICNHPVLLSVSVRDNRASSQPAIDHIPVMGQSGASFDRLPKEHFFGLGRSATTNKPVGAYVMMFGKPTVDQLTRVKIYGNRGKNDATIGQEVAYFHAGARTHFGAAIDDQPVPGTHFSFPVSIAISLAKPDDIDSSQDVELDGSASLELVYL